MKSNWAFHAVFMFHSFVAISAFGSETNPQLFKNYFKVFRNDKGTITSIRVDKKNEIDLVKVTKDLVIRYEQFKALNIQPEDFENKNQIHLGDIEGLELWGNLKFDFYNEIFLLPIKQVANEKKFINLIYELQKLILRNTQNADVLAKPYSPNYFLGESIRDRLLQEAERLISRRVVDAFGVSLAHHLFEKTLDQIELRRSYYQYMLLQILNTTKANELGFSKDERMFLLSSLMESRVAWYDTNKREAIKKNWKGFGVAELSAIKTEVQEKWDSIAGDFSKSEMINFAFSDSSYNDLRYIHNLLVDRSAISSDPSVSFKYFNPLQTKRDRETYEILDMGFSTIPIVSIISDIARYYLRKLYWDQIKTEGSLYMYFDQQQNRLMCDKIRDQSVNPFLVREL